MPGDSINTVIAKLEEIIQWSRESQNRIGYFAALYLRVTTTIKSKIGIGYFENDERLEKLDVTFAERYFEAVEQYRNNDPALPAAWAVALKATERSDLVIVQQLLSSMNPHINIDLAVAAARTAPGASIQVLHGDFLKVNSVLASIVPTVMKEVGRCRR